MMFKRILQIATLPVALLLVTATANAATTNPYAGAWWVNDPSGYGTIAGISPVAAKVQFFNGATRTFAISNHEYHQLRGLVGDTVQFNVAHDVFHAVTA